MSKAAEKILLAHLHAMGDCLYATVIARQIKHDYPYSILTWGISKECRPIIDENPDVDKIWVFESAGMDRGQQWRAFEREALRRKEAGEYDRIFFTQIDPGNYQNYDGTVRASIYRAYPAKITVPDQPVIRLSGKEKRDVADFAARHSLKAKKNVLLFEYTYGSGQSFLTVKSALKIAENIVSSVPDTCVILTAKDPLETQHPDIIDASQLSFRANLALTHYCTLLIGCSSGVSWLCTAGSAKSLPMIQLLAKKTSVYASFVHDYEYRGQSTERFLEMLDCDAGKVTRCILTCLFKGFASAKAEFHEPISINFDFYARSVLRCVYHRRFSEARRSVCVTLRRYGFRLCLVQSLLTVGLKLVHDLLCRRLFDVNSKTDTRCCAGLNSRSDFGADPDSSVNLDSSVNSSVFRNPRATCKPNSRTSK